MLAVVGLSLTALLWVLWVVSKVEHRAGRAAVFDIEIHALGDAPLWVLLAAGLLITNGFAMLRWAVVAAEFTRRNLGHGYGVSVPFPIGKMTAVSVLYVGLSVIVFYAARAVGG